MDDLRSGRRRLSVGHMFGWPRRGRGTSRVHRTAGRYWSDGRLLDGGLRIANRQVRSTLRGQRQPVRLVRGGLLGPGKPLWGRFLRHVGRLERRHRHVGECSDIGTVNRNTFTMMINNIYYDIQYYSSYTKVGSHLYWLIIHYAIMTSSLHWMIILAGAGFRGGLSGMQPRVSHNYIIF